MPFAHPFMPLISIHLVLVQVTETKSISFELTTSIKAYALFVYRNKFQLSLYRYRIELCTLMIILISALYLLYAKLEEDHGLARHAMAVYERATAAVLPEEQFEVNVFLFSIHRVQNGVKRL